MYSIQIYSSMSLKGINQDQHQGFPHTEASPKISEDSNTSIPYDCKVTGLPLTFIE